MNANTETATLGGMIKLDLETGTLTLTDEVKEVVKGVGGVRVIGHRMWGRGHIDGRGVTWENVWAMPGKIYKGHGDGTASTYDLGPMCLDAAQRQGIPVRVKFG